MKTKDICTAQAIELTIQGFVNKKWDKLEDFLLTNDEVVDAWLPCLECELETDAIRGVLVFLASFNGTKIMSSISLVSEPSSPAFSVESKPLANLL